MVLEVLYFINFLLYACNDFRLVFILESRTVFVLISIVFQFDYSSFFVLVKYFIYILYFY